MPVFDLALVKVINSVSDTPLIPGTSTVTFDIVVYNQGLSRPRMFRWSITQATLPAWTTPPTAGPASDDNAGRTAGPRRGGHHDDYAWCTSHGDRHHCQLRRDRLGAGRERQCATDIDSTPDSTNDELTDGDPIKDNFTEEDALTNPGVDDEDDHDIASLTVDAFDLALVKRVDSVSTTPILPGTQITYTIEVFNQGDITATAPIAVVDYLDTANFTLLSGGWNTADPAKPTIDITNDIGPGQSESVQIVLQVNAGTAGQTLQNKAEIADDGAPTDTDSTPDTDDTETPVKPGVTTEDGLGNPGVDDEDDHDLVEITVSEAVIVGDYVWFDENADGVQDGAESGLAGATVELFVTTDGGATLTAATDIDGNAIGVQTTGADGLYEFENLAPGEYVVRVTPPAGYALTQGGSDPDNNDNTDSNGLGDRWRDVRREPAGAARRG